MSMARQQFAMVPIDRLRLTDNVRREPGDIDELVESIRQFGILEPLVGCATEDRENVDVLMGQRRLAAARAAGLTEVPVVLRQRPAKRERVLMQLAENLDRSDMSPIDEALAFQELVDEGMRQNQIATAVHRSGAHITFRLKLLKMPECLRVALDVGWVKPSTALEIPNDLFSDDLAVKKLAKLVHKGDAAVRSWWIDAARDNTTMSRKYQQTFTVTIGREAHTTATQASREAGITLRDWVRDVILATATREEAG